MSSDPACDDFLPLPAGLPGASGAAGATGPTGAAGASGPASYTSLTAGFTMPADEVGVAIQVGSTAWMAAGLTVYIAAAGYFNVDSVDSATGATVSPTTTATNAAETSAIPSGGRVTPAGLSQLDVTVTNALGVRLDVLEAATPGNRNYYAASAPSGGGLLVGDTWFDTSDGYRIYRYDGATWNDVQRVLTLADFGTGVRPISSGTAFPSSPSEGDFFFRTDSDKLYRYISSSWSAAVPAGELTGEVDGSLLAANSVVAGKIAAAAISSTHVGTNLLIAEAANIGDGVITSAKIATLDAGKISAGDIQSVNLGYTGKIFHPSYSANTFHAIELGTTFDASFVFTSGTAFSFGSHPGLAAYGPGHASWGTSSTIKMCPDSDGYVRVQIQGRLIGYTGLIAIYYRKNGTGSYIPLASRSSADGSDAIIDTTRSISGIAATDSLEFFVGPCDADGDTTGTTCRYELDVAVFNW